MDYVALKAADAQLGIADPAASATALNALTTSVTMPVSTDDIRALLWRANLLGKVAVLASDLNVASIQRAQADRGILLMSIINSGRTINTAADWQMITDTTTALVAANIITAAVQTSIVALRTSTIHQWAGVVADDVRAARALP